VHCNTQCNTTATLSAIQKQHALQHTVQYNSNMHCNTQCNTTATCTATHLCRSAKQDQFEVEVQIVVEGRRRHVEEPVVCCRVLQFIAVCCSVLQCVGCDGRPKMSHTRACGVYRELQCVVTCSVCCSVLRRAGFCERPKTSHRSACRVLQGVLQSVLQCVAVCCSVLVVVEGRRHHKHEPLRQV